MYLILKSYLKKNYYYLFISRRVVPICNLKLNTIGRFRKNVNINIPRCYKSFGLKSSLNTAILLFVKI